MISACELQSGQLVLVLWGDGCSSETLKSYVEDLQSRVEPAGHVQLENVQRLSMAKLTASSFDVVIAGELVAMNHSVDTLSELARVLKPSGCIYLHGVVSESATDDFRSADSLQSALRLAGFVDVEKPTAVPLSDDDKATLKAVHGETPVDVITLSAKKPAYEVGSSAPLKLSFASTPEVPSSVAAAWTLTADDMVDDDVDLINSDDLLDEDDFKKPDPASLRATCGTDGPKKKKACKNCTCGLAEEQDDERQEARKNTQNATSSCGSCYLGDAFRCSSCPYIGLPAFKPGEKVAITGAMLAGGNK